MSQHNYDYEFRWSNNDWRKAHEGKRCRVLARARMNSVLIEFEDGEQTCTSRNAIRKLANSGEQK